MDLKHIFLVVLACLVAARVVEVESRSRRPSGSWTMGSYFRQKACSGGNLVKIDTDQCLKVYDGKRQCRAKCNGASTREPRAELTFVEVKRKKCIQFTDDRDGIKYALKVIKGTNVAFEEHECHGTRDVNFLFEEEKVGKHYQYKQTFINTAMCLGVGGDCGEILILTSANNGDKRCLFRKRRKGVVKHGAATI